MAFITRSILILLALYGLVFAVGDLYLSQHGAPLWIAIFFAVGFIGLQYAMSPWIVEHIFDIAWDDEAALGIRLRSESTSLSILEQPSSPCASTLFPAVNRKFVEELCSQRGLRVPRLGVIDSNTPNAFSFGRLRSDARVVITTGLIDVLTPEETNAVLAHEIGHIEHYDFLVMTVASLAPLLLYQIYVWMDKLSNTKVIAQGAYLCYWLSQWIVLLLNRTREYHADHYSAEVTHAPDMLSSALVKIAYGMVRAEGAFREARAGDSKSDKAFHERQNRLGKAIALMGISNLRSGTSLAVGMANPEQAAAVMRWDLVNPWARLYEMSSTHPLTALRVRSLNAEAEKLHRPAQYPLPQNQSLRWGLFPLEFLLWAIPWVCGGIVLFDYLCGSLLAYVHISLPPRYLPILMLIAGVSWLPRIALRYRAGFRDTDIGTLLVDMDASQMRTRPVRLKGEIIGRGVPGAFWSPDLVLRDETGMLFVFNRQSIPFARFLFAVDKADAFIDEKVELQGWYRRGLAPYVELHRMTSANNSYRSYSMWIQLAISATVVAFGWLWLLY